MPSVFAELFDARLSPAGRGDTVDKFRPPSEVARGRTGRELFDKKMTLRSPTPDNPDRAL